MHKYIHTCIHSYTHIHIYIPTHTHMYTYTHKCTLHTYIHIHVYIPTHTCIHTYTQVHYIPTYIYIHTHTHTHIKPTFPHTGCSFLLQSPQANSMTSEIQPRLLPIRYCTDKVPLGVTQHEVLAASLNKVHTRHSRLSE